MNATSRSERALAHDESTNTLIRRYRRMRLSIDRHFGFEPDHVAAVARELLGRS